MMVEKLVSVIVPVYNGSDFIEETINSVLCQTLIDFELIVLNDGSVDDTLFKLETIAKRDSRIRIVDKANTGVSDSRNKGLDLASGEFIAFLDADDVWRPEYLMEKIQILRLHPNLDWVYSNYKLIDAESSIIGTYHFHLSKNIANDLLKWKIAINPSNFFIRSIIIKGKVFFDTNFTTAADQDFIFNFSENSNGYLIQEELFSYRILPNSMSRNVALQEKEHVLVYKKAAKNKLFKSFWFKQKCFSNMYLILAGSWWVNGGNKLRALKFVFKSIIIYPPQLINVLKKRI